MTPRKIISTERCLLTGDTIVRLSDGCSVRFDYHTMQREPIDGLLESIGVIGKGDTVDVIQYGRKVGELPAFWHPGIARSKSFLYDYRHGDLEMRDGKWIASRTLGGGDLDCLIGFVRKGDDPSERQA